MARQFMPVDRDAPVLLPVNMLDWVPKDHVVRLVIDTVEELASPELVARLVPATRSRKGRRRYDPVMLLTLLMYSYMRGVLSSRAVEDRCRYDVTFRVACGKHVPDHTVIARFRKLAFGQDGLVEDLFYQVLFTCAAAGLGRLSVVACDGVKIAANASKEANRTEAGLEKIAGQVIASARAAAAAEESGGAGPAGTDLLDGQALPAGWSDPRSRAGRVRACLEDLRGAREGAAAAARAAGQAYLDGLGAGTTAAGRPPAAVALAAGQIRLEQIIAAQEAALADWQARKAAGRRVTNRPLPPGAGSAVAKARARLEQLRAQAEAEAEAAGAENKPQPVRNVTDPDSRLVPVRGGGFKQGYNCQDAAADDRLMLGGYACQDTGDAQQAQRIDQIAVRGAAVVAAAHAVHAGDPVMLRRCHSRLCRSRDKDDPGHDIAACHATMTGGTGTIVKDAGYYSEDNISAPGPDRLTATGKTRDLAKQAREDPAQGPPPEDATRAQANAWRLRTPEGRAIYKRRAPDVEGLHASIEDRIGLRRFSVRGLGNATSEFLFAGIAHNMRLLAAVS
jgi:transposase